MKKPPPGGGGGSWWYGSKKYDKEKKKLYSKAGEKTQEADDKLRFHALSEWHPYRRPQLFRE